MRRNILHKNAYDRLAEACASYNANARLVEAAKRDVAQAELRGGMHYGKTTAEYQGRLERERQELNRAKSDVVRRALALIEEISE